jgi:hypothetical protein
VGLVWVVFGAVGSFAFVTFDDPVYVLSNQHVTSGLTWENARWALTTGHASNWHPLTWVSHMLDVELYGMQAGGHHVTSAALHALNAVLLLVLIARATGTFWRAWFVAALFAVHPLHVESVAWVSERKDVLSTAFGLAAGLAWLSYIRAESGTRRSVAYTGTTVLLALGLMAKPMLVSFPFVLLLADAWPLDRLKDSAARRRAVVEKLPLFAVCIASSVVTAVVQHAGRAMEPGAAVDLPQRVVNAVVACARYLVMTVWPTDLAVLYPHPALPGGTPLAWWQIAGSAALLTAITVVTLRWRRLGWPAVAWLAYLGTLVPVLGLVQVGSQAIADRYTYVPLTGFFVLVAWSAGAFVVRRPKAKAPVALACAALLVTFTALAREQTGVWRNVGTLYERALAVAPRMPVLLVNVAVHHRQAGRVDEAIVWYEKALAVDPDFELALFNLAVARHFKQEYAAAEGGYRRVLELNPNHVKALFNLSAVLISQGRAAEAEPFRRRALELEPGLRTGPGPSPGG